jgi:tRNA (mo5U34)-methyltransferase
MADLPSDHPRALSPEELRAEVARRHWFHTIELQPGLKTPGHYQPDTQWLLDTLRLPGEYEGKSVLDLGCADGGHSIGFARRGATVTATDLFSPGFRNVEWLARWFDLPITYEQATVYDHQGGPYHLVLASGVLYHLQHPLLGLQCLNRLTRETLVLETAITPGRGMFCTFYPGSELANDPSNWWTPTEQCLRAMLEVAGFRVERLVQHVKSRCILAATKVAERPPALDAVAVYKECYGTTPP